MSTLVFSIVIGFPAIGALAAWFAALRSWRSLTLGVSGGSALPEMRRRLVPLLVMPSSLIMYGLVVSLIVLGEAVPDTVALPSALSYGVPGLLAGLGTAVIYRQGVRAAVASTQDFGRVLVLAVMPQFSAVCGLIVAFLLIGGGSGRIGDVLFGRDAQWLVSTLAMVGGFGGPAGAWLAASAWDFATTKTWPRALVRSARGGLFGITCFALAIIFLSDWLILAFVVAWFGGTVVLGLILYMTAKHKRLRATRTS